MPEPELVHRPDRRPAHHRGLAGGLQHGAATQLAGVSDPGGIRSPSSSAPVAYGSHRAAARPGPSFIGVRKPPGSYIMTGPRTGGRSPGLNWVTFLPTASTWPATSRPGRVIFGLRS